MGIDADRAGSSCDDLYRMLPSVTDLLRVDRIDLLFQSHKRNVVVNALRRALEQARDEIAQGLHTRATLSERVAALPLAVAENVSRRYQFSLRPVVNATGVILHTNLGRAPLSRLALDHVVQIASAYSNLELDLDSGERGTRDVHVESLILTLVRGEVGVADHQRASRAVIVNNCAAATFLALHTLANGREVIVSRGELVEIGGGFRIPEILMESGALLKEVGTTNRTRLSDYEHALSPNTGLILRVHQSNFSMEGFVERPSLEELVSFGKHVQIPVFEDQGTGLVQSLESCGIRGETTLSESFAKGCDLVAASGDKLLGGPQCGILVGNKDLIDRIRVNPLFRTFRVDKLCYAALEATLVEYLCDAPEGIPIVRMMRATPQEIRHRCEQIVSDMSSSTLRVEVVPIESVVGGGAAPKARLQSYAISLRHSDLDADALQGALRQLDPPIVGRVNDDLVLLDLRTVDTELDPYLIQVLTHALPARVTFEEARS